jgi:signal transduction histidine kinase
MMNSQAAVPLFRVHPAVASQSTAERGWILSLAPGFRTCLIALLAALSYYAGSQVGFWLTPVETPISTFWPPNAVLLAFFLLNPTRSWWVLILAVLPAHFLIQLKMGIPALSALGWFVSNTGEALLGAASIRFLKKDKPLFESAQGVVIFVVFGVLFATLLTSFLDAANTMFTGLGKGYWTLFTNRLTSNLIADLTIVPTILILGTDGIARFRKARFARYVEACALAVSVVLVAIVVLSGGNAALNFPALIYAPFPLLLWAAVRFGVGGLSASTLVVTLIVMWNAMHGRGPFGTLPIVDRVLALRVLLLIFALPLMLTAALLAERRLNNELLRNVRGRLISSQEQERHRLARELHDNILQQLTLVGLSVENLRARCDPFMKSNLDQLYKQVSGIHDATLGLSHDLYPFTVEYLGLPLALEKLCRDTAARGSVTINCSIENVWADPSATVSYCLFRVARAAIENIVLHSHAKAAAVELKFRAGRIYLRIADDGSGMVLGRSEGVGLTRVRQELLALDGTFQIVSAPSNGTTVEASVPVKQPLPLETSSDSQGPMQL